MPKFEWSGRDERGRNAVSGEMDAASKAAALSALKSAGILVSQIVEIGDHRASGAGPQLAARAVRATGPGWRNALIALGAIGAALAFTLIQPIDFIRCEVDRHCSIDHWTIATNEHWVEKLADVQKASVETHEEIPHDGLGRPMHAVHHITIELQSPTASISADPTQLPIPASRERIADELQDFLDHPQSQGYAAWQGEGGQMIIVGVLLLTGLGFAGAAWREWRR
ncbi:MAG: hypothetical protein ABI411_15690 [Tahibacter sp.]